uniref:SHSP domain-containing protein n=1 Tax=Oryza brachyantha TaxID=4533 RepID=J3LMB6_ORYBR
MSLIRRSNVFDPFSLDLWDPFHGFPFGSSGSGSGLLPRPNSDTAAFAGARIDWKETPEAHVFKADVPGLKEEEVKVEVEDGNVLQISGERSKEHEEKTGGGQGGGRGRQHTPDQRRAQQGAGGEDGHVAPRRAQQRQVPPQIPPPRQRQTRADQGVHGERRAHRHRAQGGGQEARRQIHPDLRLDAIISSCAIGEEHGGVLLLPALSVLKEQ